MNTNELPKLTAQESKCVMNYFTCYLGNKVQSYRNAYDCKNSNENTIYKEACKFFKNPKITPWLEYYEQSLQEFNEEEIRYTRKEFMEELDRIRSKTEDNQKTIGIALKAVELKGKASGLLKENVQLSGTTTVQMGNVEVGGQPMEFNIGTNDAANNTTNDSTGDIEVTSEDAADDKRI